MEKLKYNLGVFAVFDLLKLDNDNCLKMYQKLNHISPEILSDLLLSTMVAMYNSSLLTSSSISNIQLLFNQLYMDYPEKTVYFNKNSYEIRKYLKKAKIDKGSKLLFDDIEKRYFGINSFIDELINKRKVSDYYLENYEEIMEDIVFDAYVFEYFLTDNFDEKTLIDIRFIYSINYLYLSKPELFDDELKTKTKKILLKIKEIDDNEEASKLMKKVMKDGFKF